MDNLDPEVGHRYVERPPFCLLAINDVVFKAFEYDIFAYHQEELIRKNLRVRLNYFITFLASMFDENEIRKTDMGVVIPVGQTVRLELFQEFFDGYIIFIAG